MASLFGGFQWVDPFTMFGELSILVFVSSIIAISCFLIAGVFIYLYYKKFYAIGEVPKGWKYFFSGLILSSLYQLLKVPFTYEWVYGNIFTALFLIFQLIAIGILAYGLYLLKKEIEIK